MLIEAELNKQQKIYDVARQKEIADSMAIEKNYLDLINRGNLYFANENWVPAKQMFLKAAELKPGRKYPKYKLEDIRTAVELFNKKNDSVQINLDSILPPTDVPEKKEPRKFVYTPPSEEELERRLRNDIITQITKEEPNDSVIKKRLSFIAEVLDAPIDPKPLVALATNNESVTIKSFVTTPKKAFRQDSVENIKKTAAPQPKATPKTVGNDGVFFDDATYQDSLCKKYPAFKTVEVTETLYTKTTKVFMHKKNRVTIYMKVEHAWGGIFYFIDRTPLVPENISQSYYEVVTRSIDNDEMINEQN